jgi:hypothetical protein
LILSLSQKEMSTDLASLIRAATLVGFGTLEGYAFATSGIAYPSTFRSQMLFSKQILLQLFMGAVGSSMLTQGVLSLVNYESFDNSRVWKYTTVGYRRAGLGCLILGAGMAIGGSGPTMLPSQIGVGMTSAWWVLGGSLIGGAIFSILEQQGAFNINFDAKPQEKLTLDAHLGGHYAAWSLGIGSALIAACLAVPSIFNTTTDQSSLSPLITTPPIVAGLSIGLNQLPVRLLSECGQGGSRAIMQIVSLVTGWKLAKRFKVECLSSLNQFMYVWVGTLLGAAYASQSLHLPAPQGYGPLESLLGGALMVFGARVAAGCACGHGVSGFSELGLQSMLGAAMMFAGGIATAVILGLKP